MSDLASAKVLSASGRIPSSTSFGMVLTSDAQSCSDLPLASKFKKQPFQTWYGERPTGAYDENGRGDSIDSPLELLAPSQTLLSPPTGTGVLAAVLDSGIRRSHTMFKEQQQQQKISPHSRSFVGGDNIWDVDDKLGHGTQCAGLLCGVPSQVLMHDTSEIQEIQGTAKNTQIMVCKVVEDGTSVANLGAVCSAIGYILEYNKKVEFGELANEPKVSVISLSFGSVFFHHNLTQKIQEAICHNIIVVCAAANGGMKTKLPITYPARLGHVLCVGASNEDGKPASFSPVGREIDFLAPGSSIVASTIGNDDSFCTVSGTSFAAPSLAGVVCQLLEDLRELAGRTGNLMRFNEIGQQPFVPLMSNVWCIRELLREMATAHGRHSDESGYGNLNPMEYFEKNDEEKRRIIRKMLQQ